MVSFNTIAFFWINASAEPPAWLLVWARFAAQDLILATPLLLVAGWLWHRHAPRSALVHGALAATLGLAINQGLGLLWFEPRPFMLGLGHSFLPHTPDGSFPSDHLTVIWSVAFALLFHRKWRKAGFALALMGLPVAWARVYLGVHWPLDMLGAAMVACGCALLLWPWEGALQAATRLMTRAYRRMAQPLIARHWIEA